MRNHVVTVALWALASAAACAPDPTPDPEALARYRGDKGHDPAAPGAASATVTPPPPARRVRLTVVGGTGIPDMDAGPGTTDAYLVLEVDAQRQKTSIADGPDPTWNDSFVFDVHPQGTLMATLMDADTFSDETIGVVTLPLPPVAPGAVQDVELRFREGEHGTVLLRVEGLAP